MIASRIYRIFRWSIIVVKVMYYFNAKVSISLWIWYKIFILPSLSCALSFWKMTSSSHHSKRRKLKEIFCYCIVHETRQFSLHIDSFLRIITMAFLSHFTPMNFSSLESNKVALLFVDKWTNLIYLKTHFQFWRVCGSYKFLQASLLQYR